MLEGSVLVIFLVFCVNLVYPMLSISLDYLFLMVSSVFSTVYLMPIIVLTRYDTMSSRD
jgi:hypothetical protein